MAKNCNFSKKGLGHKHRCYSVCIDDTCKWISYILSRIIGLQTLPQKLECLFQTLVTWPKNLLQTLKFWSKFHACSYKVHACSCKVNIHAWTCMNTHEIPSYILWDIRYQSTSPSVVVTDNFGWPGGGNKRSCSTVCTAFTIKMFLAIIAEHISLIDCSN